jgi:hypothetical protein
MATETHTELHAALRNLGWREDRRESGAVFFYSPADAVERMVQTIPDDASVALCAERGGGRSVTSLPEALAWAQAHECAAGR